MTKKVNPPCVRNIHKFRKTGCPEKCWDGREGCTCWVEMSISSKENPQKKDIVKMCLDMWMLRFQLDALGLLEGNQQATESFRNGMIFKKSDGSIGPKADPAMVAMLNLFQNQTLIENKEQIKEIETIED